MRQLVRVIVRKTVLGTIWFLQHKPVTLKPGETGQIQGRPKLRADLGDKLVLIDQPFENTDLGELMVRPELRLASVMSNRLVAVTVKNMSSRSLLVTRGTPIAHVFPVEVLSQSTAVRAVSESNDLTMDSFNFGDSPLPLEARRHYARNF